MAKSHYMGINPETSDSSIASEIELKDSEKQDLQQIAPIEQSFDSSQSSISQQEHEKHEEVNETVAPIPQFIEQMMVDQQIKIVSDRKNDFP